MAAPTMTVGLPDTGELLAGKYRIQRCIGRGGMGAVYLAHHELLDQPVAIKLLLPEILSDGSAVARFLNEARAAARIRNEHVAKVLDVDTLPTGAAFMVLEYLEGTDLASLLATQGALPLPQAAGYVMQALEALSLAHALGIVHRDLKPANLFLANTPAGPIIKVLDFGISKAAGPRLTAANVMLGSPSFMSPEQVHSSRDVDVRSDLWSVGVVLHQLTTGDLPFPGESANEVFAKILESEPPPPSSLLRTLPPAFDALVARCLKRDRACRVQTVLELAEALAPFAPPASLATLERIRLAQGGLPASGGALPFTGAFGPLTPHPQPSPEPNRTFRRPTGDLPAQAPSEPAAFPKTQSRPPGPAFPKTVSRDRIPAAPPPEPTPAPAAPDTDAEPRHDTPRDPLPAHGSRTFLILTIGLGAAALLAGAVYLALRPATVVLPPEPVVGPTETLIVIPPALEPEPAKPKVPRPPKKKPLRPTDPEPATEPQPLDEDAILGNRK